RADGEDVLVVGVAVGDDHAVAPVVAAGPGRPDAPVGLVPLRVAHQRLGEQHGGRGAVDRVADAVAQPDREHPRAAVAVGVLQVPRAVVRAGGPLAGRAVTGVIVVAVHAADVRVGRAREAGDDG